MTTENALNYAAGLWNKAVSILKCKVSENTYNQWFAVIVPLSVDETMMRLGVSDDFFAEWLTENYGDILTNVITEAAGKKLKFIIEPGHDKPAEQSASVEKPELRSTEGARPDQSLLDIQQTAPNCNARYTFENFVVGEENRYAFSAAQTAAASPGTFNPLYIYGGTGLGKTHLMQAVANYVKAANPNAVVRYTTCEGFLNAYVDSLRNKTSAEFRDYYRNVDLFLVDDVHHLGGKEQLQEEFFNTFNAIYNAGKQIMMTSDKQPSEIKGLEARLVSRFEAGVAAQITEPSFETRLAILRMKQDGQAFKLPDELLVFIAERISSHIRALEGARMRLVAFASAVGDSVPLTADMASNLLSDMIDKEAEMSRVSIDRILDTVASHFNIKVHDITGSKRPKNIAEPRMLAMYLSRTLTDESLKDIGLAFGGRNHTTVIHAIKQVETDCKTDEDLKRTVTTLKRKLHARA